MRNSVRIILLIVCLVNVLSCTKIEDNSVVAPPILEDTTSTSGGEIHPPEVDRIRAIVVGEGQFGHGTGSLTTLSTQNSIAYDVFRRINNRPIGDVPQSLLKIGDYYYIPVNNSRKVEVVKAETFESVETVMFDRDVIPMYAVHLGGDSIVVSDQSTTETSLMIVDINHGKERKIVRRYINLGIQTYQMKVIGNKLFVGGSTFSVFDLGDITAKGRRSVKSSSNEEFATCRFSKVTSDKYGNIWVVTQNNISCIDVQTERAIKEVSIPGLNSWISSIDICPKGQTVYVTSGTKVYSVDVDNSIAPKKAIVEHSNNDRAWTTYHMSVSRENTIFLIRVLYGSITRGRVFEYNTDGEIVNYYKNSDGKNQPYFRAGIFPHFIYYID